MAWYDKIKKAIEDTATLDVVTTTGSITLTADDMPVDDKGNVKWEDLADKVSAKIRNAKVEVVAFTHSQWDCDSFIFVKSDLSPAEKTLLESHAATVDAAHATRREAVKMVGELIGSGGN